MDRKNLWITCGLIGFIIVIIGAFVISSPIIGISTYFSNSTDENSTTNNYSPEYFSFDNSTPEATAISIARLNEGSLGFERTLGSEGINYSANAHLTSDGKYWIVNITDGIDKWVVTVDAKTWKSKKDNGSWKSLDELKAKYIADIQSRDSNGGLGKPIKVTKNGKKIWKVPVYYYHEYDPVKTDYVYVDVVTGKSKNELEDDTFNYYMGTDDWLTLKEVDDIITKMSNSEPSSSYGSLPHFKDAVRNLYSE